MHKSSNWREFLKSLDHILDNLNKGQFEEALHAARLEHENSGESAELHNIISIASASMGNLESARKSCESAIKLNPSYAEAYYNMGNITRDLGDEKSAIEYYKKTIELQQNFGFAYFNMAAILFQLRRYKEAAAGFQRTIELHPAYYAAHYNLAITLNELGEHDHAIKHCQTALADATIKADVSNTLGLLFQKMGDFKNAAYYFTQSIEINPGYTVPKDNLLELLAATDFKIDNDHIIVQSHNSLINKRKAKDSDLGREWDWSSILIATEDLFQPSNFQLQTPQSQIYRRNGLTLNCNRHFSIFNKYAIIPEYCFGCYKVQFEPNDLIGLIKIYLLFDQLQLPLNNIRKCMVELRPEVEGYYKALIYCSTSSEAHSLMVEITRKAEEFGIENLKSFLKRGCTEFGMKFDGFSHVDANCLSDFKYDPKWQEIERKHDEDYRPAEKIRDNITKAGVSVLDLLVIKNWIGYARGIGDYSLEKCNHNISHNENFYQLGLQRTQILKI